MYVTNSIVTKQYRKGITVNVFENKFFFKIFTSIVVNLDFLIYFITAIYSLAC